MNAYKITLSDGDYFVTRFNGNAAEAVAYYLGRTFNTGAASDHLVKCVKVEQIKED